MEYYYNEMMPPTVQSLQNVEPTEFKREKNVPRWIVTQAKPYIDVIYT